MYSSFVLLMGSNLAIKQKVTTKGPSPFGLAPHFLFDLKAGQAATGLSSMDATSLLSTFCGADSP